MGNPGSILTMPHLLRDCPTFYQQTMPAGRREEGTGFVRDLPVRIRSKQAYCPRASRVTKVRFWPIGGVASPASHKKSHPYRWLLRYGDFWDAVRAAKSNVPLAISCRYGQLHSSVSSLRGEHTVSCWKLFYARELRRLYRDQLHH